MRLSYTLLALLAATTASAQFAGIIGAVKGITALSTSVGKLVGTLLPGGLLLPFAAVGPLKLSLPMLFALKGLGLLKFKLLLAKMPLLAPVGVATAKFGLLKAKYGLGKTALATVGKAKLGLIQLPVKLTAAKLGVLAGATAGAKAGLAAYKTKPKMGILKAALLPSATLLRESKSLLDNVHIPMKNITVQFKHVHVPSYAVPEPELEPEEPIYGRKPTTTTPRPAPAYTPAAQVYIRAPPAYTPAPPAYTPAPPAYTPAPPAYTSAPPAYTPAPPAYTPAPPAYTPASPAYTPAPPAYTPAPPAYTPATAPEPKYRKRRGAAESEHRLTIDALNGIFAYIQTYDSDRCVHRLVCELAVQPGLAGKNFADVTQFMTNLPSDPAAPWMSYKTASATGSTSRDRTACHHHYNECGRPTEILIETARRRLAGVDF